MYIVRLRPIRRYYEDKKIKMRNNYKQEENTMNAALVGWKKEEELRAKYNCNIPAENHWFVKKT